MLVMRNCGRRIVWLCQICRKAAVDRATLLFVRERVLRSDDVQLLGSSPPERQTNLFNLRDFLATGRTVCRTWSVHRRRASAFDRRETQLR